MDRKSFLKTVGAASTIPIGSAFEKSNDVTVHFLKPKYKSYDPSGNKYDGYTYDVCDGMYSLDWVAEMGSVTWTDDLVKISKLVAVPTGDNMSNYSKNMKKQYGSSPGFPCTSPEHHRVTVQVSRTLPEEEYEKIFWSWENDSWHCKNLDEQQHIYRERFEKEDLVKVKKHGPLEIESRIQKLVDVGCKTIYVERGSEEPFSKIEKHQICLWQKHFVGCRLTEYFSFVGSKDNHESPYRRAFNNNGSVLEHRKTTKNDIDKTIYNYKENCGNLV